MLSWKDQNGSPSQRRDCLTETFNGSLFKTWETHVRVRHMVLLYMKSNEPFREPPFLLAVVSTAKPELHTHRLSFTSSLITWSLDSHICLNERCSCECCKECKPTEKHPYFRCVGWINEQIFPLQLDSVCTALKLNLDANTCIVFFTWHSVLYLIHHPHYLGHFIHALHFFFGLKQLFTAWRA